jgi:predicted DNA-binding transcriptional regulator AlpA
MPVKKKKPNEADSVFVDRYQVARLLNVAPQTVTDLVKQGRFPRPLRFNQRLQRWRRETVLNWLRRLEAEGGVA